MPAIAMSQTTTELSEGSNDESNFQVDQYMPEKDSAKVDEKYMDTQVNDELDDKPELF